MSMQEEADRFGDAIAAYLMPLRDHLTKYDWPMSEGAKVAAGRLNLSTVAESGGVAETHALRASVAARVRELHLLPQPHRDAGLEAHCSFVIRDWGGLGSNKADTIAMYCKRFTGLDIEVSEIDSFERLSAANGGNFPFEGIASWSKWLNFVWNDWALIYDARIAFSLNAIHFLRGIDARVFLAPPGRNSLLASFDTQTLAALRYLDKCGSPPPAASMNNKALQQWILSGVMHKQKTYSYYLQVMQRARDGLGLTGDHALVETEMLLFHISDKQLVRDVLASLGDVLTGKSHQAVALAA